MLIWYMNIYGILTCINRQRFNGCLSWCTKFGRASSMGKSWKVNCRWWIFCSHVWWRKAKWCTAFIVVDDVYSLVKKTIRGKTRNDTMQNLNQLATSRGETERCQGQADKPLVPSDSSRGFSQKLGSPVPSSDIPRTYPQFKGHGACALRSARSCRGTMFFLHLSQTWTPVTMFPLHPKSIWQCVKTNSTPGEHQNSW